MGKIYDTGTWFYNNARLKEIPLLNALRFEHTYRFNGGFAKWKNHQAKLTEAFINKYDLHNKKYQSVLDIGCGYGVLCKKLAEFIPIVVGIDISPTALKIARQDSRAIILRENIIDFCSGKYDLIVANSVLSYLTPSQKAKAWQNISKMQLRDMIVQY